MIKCEHCGIIKSRVLDSRSRAGNYIIRRRKCRQCYKKYTTYELREDEIVLKNKVNDIITEIGLIRGKLDRMERLLTNAKGMAE